MRLYLKNIGMLKEADVKLDGLTVIAGENDTGKSTVGKVIFSIVKAMQNYEDELEENLEKKLIVPIERLYFNLRRYFRTDKLMMNDQYYEFRELFYPSYFFKALTESSNYNKILEERIDFLQRELSSEEFERISKYFEEIKNILSIPMDKNELRKNALNKVFISEFYNEILLKGEKEGYISLNEFNDEEIFKVKMKENKICEFYFSDILYFDNTTYIETPLIINYSNLIENAKTFLDIKLYGKGIPTTSLHSKDLINKLIEIPYLENNIFSIENVIGGKFYFDREMRDFVFRKGNKKYRNLDIATGIKSFGILDILVKNDFINEKSMLIIDEPEVHLHPKWQIEYAKLIIELVKKSIKVLITSHSPYMIEAIKKYAELYDIYKKTNFYLAEDNKIFKIQNSNSLTLEKIFEKLSSPFDEFDRLDSKLMDKNG